MILRIIAFYGSLMLLGCNNETRETYLSEHRIDGIRYSQDSITIKYSLDSMLNLSEGLFYSYTKKHVDIDVSEISLDTILFNEEMTRAATLFILKYQTKHYYGNDEGKMKDKGKKVLYDGFVALTKWRNKNLIISNYKVEIGNYLEKEDCIERLREIYFNELNQYNQPEYNKFNLPDRRFWNEP